MRETRMKGKFTGGRVNYGYSCHEQKLSVIDEEAAVLLEIFTDYANGKSLTDIANDLNARGITNRGKPFLMNRIYFLLNMKSTRAFTVSVIKSLRKPIRKLFPSILQDRKNKTRRQQARQTRYGR